MIRRALCLVAAAASLGAVATTSAASAAATTTTPTHVGIVVRLSNSSTLTACVTQGGDGLDVLVRGFPNTQIPTSGPYAGFVASINGVGQNPPDDTHYWSYWHATATGWKYSSTGGGSYTPKAGSVEGWSYVSGQDDPPKPASYSYQKLCGREDPKSAPSSTRPAHPARHPTHSGTHSSAPTHPASRPAHTPTAPTSSTADAQPSTSTAARSSHPRPSRSSTAHNPARRDPSRSAEPSTDTATDGSTSAAPRSSAAAAPAPAPSLQPTASHRSGTGFPAWGTVLAIVVVAALGGTAWLRLRRRPE